MEELGAEILERVEAAAAVLRRGGIVVYPTDTLYALGARADDAAALERLRRAKLRQEGKPLPLLAADRDQVLLVARLEGVADRVAGRIWPGPLTLVLPALPGVAAAVTAGTGTVGIRVPASAVARALAARAGFPLVSTSANPAGGPAPSRVSELAPALRRQVDHVLDGGATPGGPPSTVVRLDGESVRVLREGAISPEAVAEAAR
ncbi:MAG TPA: L-threonylcarbamoyladenylate synthase [Anaeromyxobacter sp.]|nr:L-threonylcarbamoyladenylate synthase [Anaeromyxobacter sp.]